MKKLIALLLGTLILMTLVLGGCGNQPAEKPAPDAEAPNAGEPSQPDANEDALSVYVVKTDALYAKAVDAFQREAEGKELAVNVTSFDSYEAMLDVMNVELMAKGGPDVVLYNSRHSEADAQKLAQSGMFLPLDDYMKELDPAVYPAALMDAGKIADKQYFIPFSYNLIYTYTTDTLMAERGYSESGSVYEMMVSESELLADVPDKTSNEWIMYAKDVVNSFFRAAGLQFFDRNTGEITVDEAELEEVCRYLKTTIFDNMEKVHALNKKSSSNDWKAALNESSFLTEDYSFLNNVRFYQSLYEENGTGQMVALPLHKLNEPESLCASIVCFGGVNANAKDPEQAYRLLKYILDFEVTNSFQKYEERQVYYAPVSLAVYQKAMEELAGSYGSGPVTIKPLSEANKERLTAVSQRIVSASIPNISLGVSFEEILLPYFQGTDSFENCCKTLLNRLQLYVSE